MKKLDTWFNRTSTGYIGVVEYGGDRILIQDYETIEQIQKNINKFIEIGA
jgi:hypothetical protein